MKPSIEDIVRVNVEMAKDQASEYDDQSGNGMFQWYEGDAYWENTIDGVQGEGYSTERDWDDAKSLFSKMAKEAGLRFAN